MLSVQADSRSSVLQEGLAGEGGEERDGTGVRGAAPRGSAPGACLPRTLLRAVARSRAPPLVLTPRRPCPLDSSSRLVKTSIRQASAGARALAVEVIQAWSERLLREFVRFPRQGYQADPHWVPLFEADELALVSGRHPFWAYGEIRPFLPSADSRGGGPSSHRSQHPAQPVPRPSGWLLRGHRRDRRGPGPLWGGGADTTGVGLRGGLRAWVALGHRAGGLAGGGDREAHVSYARHSPLLSPAG